MQFRQKVSIILVFTLINDKLPAGSKEVINRAAIEKESVFQLPEMIVTSTKKSQSEYAQDVPMAMSVYSGQTVEDLFAVNLTDIGELSPNVRLVDIGTFRNTAMFFVRGMGVSSSIPTDEPAVGVFVDGMYLGINTGSLIDLFDVESIEILRGPQGTLFGRNVTGGAVLIQHKRPTGEYGVRGKTIVGNYDWIEQHAVIEGPLLEGLAGKLGVVTRQKDGYFDNMAVSGDRVGEEDTWLLRPMVTWMPNDDLEITFSSEFSKFEGDAVVVRQIDAQDLEDIETDLMPQSEYEIKQTVLNINWQIGPGKLTSITGWRDLESITDVDVDGSALPTLIFHTIDSTIEQDQWSEELRYAFLVHDRAELSTGLSFFTQDMLSISRRITDFGGGERRSASRGTAENTSIGLFAQTDIQLLPDSLTLTFGARQTWEEKEVEVASFGNCDFDLAPCDPDFTDEDEWDFTSGHVSLNWYSTEESLLYISWTRSFRSGGYNLRNTLGSSPGPYDEEKVNAYEIGFKGDWLDGRLRTNLALFYNDFTDLQRTVLRPSSVSAAVQEKLNAADATIAGFEVEVNFIPIEQLQLDASLGYVDASYDQYEGLDVDGALDPDGPNMPDPELAEDLDFLGVPKWTAYIGGAYTIPLIWKYGGEFVLRGSASFTDEHPLTETNDVIQDSYTLVNASLSYLFDNDNVSLSVFGRNLLDERYAFFATASFGGVEWAAQPGATWGIELKYSF